MRSSSRKREREHDQENDQAVLESTIKKPAISPQKTSIFKEIQNYHNWEVLIVNERDVIISANMKRIAERCQEKQFNLEYLYDWLAIFQFLSKPKLVRPYLDKLESQLQEQAARLGQEGKLKVNYDGKWGFLSRHSQRYKRHKILSRTLYQWAREEGFERKAKAINFLDADVFLNLLSTKTIFKDSSVRADIQHGVWSHPLQWYCIIERHKESPFLQHTPMAVLQSFGDKRQLLVSRMLGFAWDFVLDRSDKVFFASPTEITKCMLSSDSRERWPLLAGTIVRHERKSRGKHNGYEKYTHMLNEKHKHTQHKGIVLRKL